MVKYEEFGELVIWHKVNTDPGFYEELGPFFGSREIEKELGYKMYDDPGRVWLIVKDGKAVVAVSSYEIKGKKAYLRSTYVMPEYRQNGIYKKLCDISEREIKAAGGVAEVSVTARENSVMSTNWTKRGYSEHSRRGQFIVFKKVIA